MAFPALILFTLGHSAAWSKTLYVEKTGTDDGVCAKAAPCETIQHALDSATPNSRVIVGIGEFEGSITISQPGIKLVSVAGAHGTTIIADSADAIDIVGDKVSVGQKRKGFTLTGDFDGGDGISVDGDRAKIENNILFNTMLDGSMESDTDDAISLDGGSRATIRFNQIRGFQYGIYQNTASTDIEKHLITDNRIEGADGGSKATIELDMNPGSKTRIDGNVIIDTSGEGGIYLTSDTTTLKSGIKVTNNIILNTDDDAIEIDYGNPLVQNNTIAGVFDSDSAGVRIYDTIGAVVKKNLIRNVPVGLRHEVDNYGPLDTTFSQNIVDDVSEYAIQLEDEDGTFKQIQQNNFTDIACPIEKQFSVAPAETIVTKKNFWGDPADTADGGIPDLSCDTNANDALGTDLEMNPTLKPNAVKYKSPI